MDRSESFPLLQPADILKHCRISLAMTFVTEEHILRPTSESTRSIYSQLLYIALRYSLRNRELPELQEVSISLVLLLHKIRDITPILGCKQPFRLTDLLVPEPRRTRYFFSAFINFIKFRTDEEIFSEQLNKERECVGFQEEYEKVKNELDAVRGEIDKMVEKREAAKPIIAEKTCKIEELKSAKSNSEAFQNALAADTLRLTQEIEDTQEMTSQTQRRVSDMEAHLAALERQVTSPTEVKSALRRATEILENEQFRVMEIEQKFKEIARMTKICLDAQEGVKAAKSELEILSYCKTHWIETKKRAKNKEESLKSLIRALELQAMKVTAAQRVQATTSEKMQREWEAAEGRLQALGTAGKVKKEEFAQVKSETMQKQEEIAKIRQKIEELELRIRDEDERFERDFQQSTEALNGIRAALEEYASRLQRIIEKANFEVRNALSRS
jgi:hypothetical protein